MPDTRASLITPVLIGGCFIILLSFLIRSSFGVFQIPISDEFGWLRAEFSMAIAIQNLAWGIGQPIFGAMAEKIGDRKALLIGAVMYAVGLAVSSLAWTPEQHWALEVLVGFGIAGTGFGVLLAVVGRTSSDENRSMSLAILTAAGSGGQILGPPLAEWLLTIMTWQQVFLVFAAMILAALLFLPMIKTPPAASKAELEESLGGILKKAFRDPSYTLIFLGFFSCGYQLSFVVAHFPALITEMCGPVDPAGNLAAIGITTTSALGAVAISIIGLANIAGTLTAGWLGKYYPKKYLLAWIYTGRTIAAAMFILFPITPTTVVLFSVVMGSLWLATVPLTSGLVAHIYGLRYMGTLYGIIFFSHQLGAFVGVWLGGRMYDAYGDYTAVWWVGVAVGAFSAIVHLPVREKPLSERALAA
ncbi:Transmembrane transporter, major facilitator family [Candidatus Rhodobacter oscarellae]|uniref:Transmembrane transporter, major facilitator family n=1 Tax=Candidatus Rhodobacter oscarellae TaxID=1675527 RepID=A0A0J9EB87_9RHOB|nr:MFS transporter [Candidatus Rhodobacter lobularis]KMW58949.1 Transmembrane transporter, major facilitator family [Candidatus Rhodobacter lobularis]